MKKRYIGTTVGIVGAAAGYYFLNRSKKTSGFTNTIEDAGVPDQTNDKDITQLENAKMVSEGSQFGVHYYNELKEKETEQANPIQ
ncbi:MULTISPECIES: hypothetical protein [unclassified Virgibacillus]|uniref:hypothetical protein n=1 Tax=unclassified Virgibacillus TaxID=2620237 RepID=UPI0024DE1F8C|nr:hypothetical protein [Virgibacillus sp. LDC-1]